ncbi:sigma-70 family RNA polymerase sigma factor [Novipirellula artificiosorum]|uniref:RNA polymerase principal sigma factor HrdA n=1 Tax=Novipirellula artificiosorum TaxID=2528016 RepID=A0A5C6E1Q1_9BACT|nr:sigma-70 family RNA polymerase sigma factor [Novipirellula artificiosorum]TWU41917.1 RNA polymerase principal sigma factor HrdA [Novipirellula artificiosorum]
MTKASLSSRVATLDSLTSEPKGDESVLEDSSASTLPARMPSWMKMDELVSASSEADSLARDYGSLSKEDLKRATKMQLRQEIGFISNSEFSQTEIGREIFAAPLQLAPRQKEVGVRTATRSGADLPIHLGRLCEASLLTPEQESLLFQRMNFLLHQAAAHRRLLNPSRPSRARLALVDRLIAMAHWHRDRIVEANLRLVFSIVKKFVNANNQFDELLSDGIVALMRAVEKFDYDRGFRFSTYATQVVRRNSYRTIVFNQQERQKVIGGLQDMNLDLSDEDRGSSISEGRWHELRSRLAAMLEDLDRREKLIIRARFSLGSHRKVHTLQSLADRLGISKERVRQLERRAMEKLRSMAGDVRLAELEV